MPFFDVKAVIIDVKIGNISKLLFKILCFCRIFHLFSITFIDLYSSIYFPFPFSFIGLIGTI